MNEKKESIASDMKEHERIKELSLSAKNGRKKREQRPSLCDRSGVKRAESGLSEKSERERERPGDKSTALCYYVRDGSENGSARNVT